MKQFSDSEAAILHCLWEFGEQSAREIHDRVASQFNWAYSTTRTVLTRMVQKGLVGSQSFHGLTIFVPEISRARAYAEEIWNFSRRLLDLETSPVVSLVAEDKGLSKKEVAELRRFLRRAAKESGEK